MAEPRDPDVVLKRLYAELVARRPTIDKATDYYDGAHNLAFAGEKFLEAFGGLFDAFADNWCAVVADAVEERMEVQGFRVNQEPKTDAAATEIWQRNELDLQAPMGHLDGLIAGVFYAIVWPDDDDKAEITVESAWNTIVECHPKIHRRRTAALRTYLGDDGYEHAEIWLDGRVYLRRSKSRRTSGFPSTGGNWTIDETTEVSGDLDVEGSMPSPFGATIPVVEFRNRPRLRPSRRARWGAHSELASVIPLQDTVNKLLADMLVASEFAAFPQRHLVGYEPAEALDPTTGKPTGATIPPDFKSGPGKLWWLENADATFGQFAAADLSSCVQAIEMVVQHIASISATPTHYLRASADRLSGESIKSAESGLVSKVRRRLRVCGAGWEEVMRLAGKLEKAEELANAEQMETVWRDPETRTESEHVDALVKKKQLDVPAPQLWEEAGYTPQQIERFPAYRAQMQLEGMAANAAERARLATEESERLRAASLEATGGLPPLAAV